MLAIRPCAVWTSPTLIIHKHPETRQKGPYELGQLRCWHCLLLGYAPLDFTYFGVFFLHRLHHAPSNKWKARPIRFYLFARYEYDRYHSTKKCKSDHNLSEIKEKKGGRLVVCMCSSNTRFKFQIETRKIERGIEVVPLVLIVTCLMYRNRFWVVSLEWWRTGWWVRDLVRCLVLKLRQTFRLYGNL